MIDRARHALYAATHDILTVPLAVIGALLVLLVGFAATRPGPVPFVLEPEFGVSPVGVEVSRLAPIRVTYKRPPAAQDGSQMIAVEPSLPGTYAWLDERTLLFQPDFPGYERGREYEVRVAPQPDAELNEQFVHTFTTAGALKVVSVIPSPDDTDVVAASPVFVQFTRGVAPLTTLAEMEKQGPVLQFDPPLPGRGEWLNTALYRYTPSAELPPNTQYEVKLVDGLSAAADGQLAEGYAWGFSTYGPAVVKVTPDDNTKYASPRQPVTIEFNQPMNRPAVEQAFALHVAGEQPVAGSFEWADDDKKVTFTPVGLKLDGTYIVELAAAVAGRTGGQTPTAWSSVFVTVGLPRVVGTSPTDGATLTNSYPRWQVTFNNPMDRDSFKDRVLISGHRAEEVRTFWSNNDTEMYVSGFFRPSTEYVAEFTDGALDRYGQPVAAFSVRFVTAQATPSVSFAIPGGNGTYSASAEQILYIQSQNTSAVAFKLYRLSEADYRAWHQRSGPWSPSAPPIREWRESVENVPNLLVTSSTRLAENGALPKGNYYIEGSGAEVSRSYRSEAIFSVVDTALVLKTSQDELLAWVLDLDSGQPLEGIEVEVAWGDVVGDRKQRTGPGGIARFKIPVQYSSREERRQFVWVRDQGRHGVSGIEWGRSYSYAGYPSGGFAREYVGHLYGDRVIYRPGEQVQLKGVVRIDDDARYPIPAESERFTLTIVGPGRSSQLTSIPVTVNEFGTFAASFDLPGNAPIGDYTARVEPASPKTDQYSATFATAQFSVIEFRRAEFEVGVQAEQLRSAGDPINATVNAAFLFGGAMSGASVSWNVFVSPRTLRGSGVYAGYSFNDIDPYQSSIEANSRRIDGTGTTDASGRLRFTVPTNQVPTYTAQNFTISATVLDQSGQALSSSFTAGVFPGDLLVGLRPADYLGLTGVPAAVRLLTMTQEGGDAPNREVSLRIYQRQWVTTKVQDVGGSTSYRSQPVDTLVQEIPTRTAADSEARVEFTPTGVGTYRIVAEVADDRGRVARAATYLYVTGREQALWRIGNGDTFDLIADRDSYSPGDVADILVPAPFDRATALITVERGKNIRQEVKRFETNSERIKIPLDAGSMPNVYVSVVLYRPADAEDPVPRYALATINLRVSTESRVLNVQIAADRAVAHPRDTVRYDLKVTDSTGTGVRSEVSVAVVDKAVIVLAEERGPNGLRAFWFERGLGVTTGSSLALSINRSNDTFLKLYGGPKGGDGFADDGTRKEFKNTAFWQAQVVTDANGNASVEVPLPDNATTWRLQARAIADETRVGEAVHELLTTKPVISRPALPRFVRVGDALTLRMLVRNSTDQASAATATIEVEGVEIADRAPRQLQVPAEGSVFAEWPATVGAATEVKVTFTAVTPDGLRDAVEMTLPVYEALTPETTATGGIVEGDSALEAVFLPAFAVATGGRLDVTLDQSAVAALTPELRHFQRLAGEGTTAVSTRLLAHLGAHLQGRTDESASIRSDIAGLLARATPGGGWPPCYTCSVDVETTAVAMMALGEARGAGFAVDANTLAGGRRYLKAQLALPSDVNRPADPNQRARLLYAIARSGPAGGEASTLRALYEQYRLQLNNSGRAYLMLAMREAGINDNMSTSLLTDLTARTIPSANGNHWEDPVVGTMYSEPTIQTTSIGVLALARVSPRHLLIRETVRWLAFARASSATYSPVQRAYEIYALGSFAQASGEGLSDYDYSVQLNGSPLMDGRFTTGAASVSKSVPLADLKRGSVNLLDIARDARAGGRMYYTANLHYQTPATDIDAVNRGFAIAREYARTEDPLTPVTQVRVGDTVQVKLTVIVEAEKRQIDITDLLPAGLEPIDPRLKVVSPATLKQAQDEQRKLNRDSTQYVAPWHRWYYSPWTNVQLKDDRLLLQATTLPKGVHEYVYLARATTPGTFFVPPTVAFETNFPENFGRSDSGSFVVLP